MVLCAFTLGADDFSFDNLFDEGDSTASESALSVNGEAILPLTLSVGDISESETWETDSLEDGSYTTDAEFKLDLAYTTEKADFAVSLNISEDTLGEDLSANTLFDDLSVTWYGDNITTKIGYQELVWGKGDKVHVVNVINAQDYSEFLNNDYQDRIMAQPMVDFKVSPSMNSQLEFVFVPTFTADKMATEGDWVVSETQELIDAVTSGLSTSAAALYTAYTSAYSDGIASVATTAYLSEYSEMDALLPDTASLAYSQVGVRYTHTLGGMDLGAMYYYGRDKSPTYTVSGSTYEDIELDYDKLQVFGLEMGTVLAGFNLRGEGAYYLTEDYDGTDGDIHNPSLNYVAGFDRNLPINNMNLNFQATGSYMFFHDELTSGDVEEDDDVTSTMLVMKISDTFNHEKVKPELTLLYCVEDQSAMIKPSVTFVMDGNLAISLSGSAFTGGDDSFFGQFDDEDFIELCTSYKY